jgi:flagellar basal body rod protein FlgG
MSIGLYQSAASLSALERWQAVVAQNITSSQVTGYRKRTIDFSSEMAGELQSDPRHPVGKGEGTGTIFPKVNTGISFTNGETLPTHRSLDVAIQGDGFFEVERGDGSHAYTRGGEFHIDAKRSLRSSGGDAVLGTDGRPIVLLPQAGAELVINQDGTVLQGGTTIGKLSVQKFADNSRLIPLSGGLFVPSAGTPDPVPATPELLQGYLEGSNITPLREMVDLVLISRAYEANQRIITTLDQQMGKTLDALG